MLYNWIKHGFISRLHCGIAHWNSSTAHRIYAKIISIIPETPSTTEALIVEHASYTSAVQWANFSNAKWTVDTGHAVICYSSLELWFLALWHCISQQACQYIQPSDCVWRPKTVRGTPGRKADSLTSLERQPKRWLVFQKATRDQIIQLSSFYLYNTRSCFAMAFSRLPPFSTWAIYCIMLQRGQ